MQTWEVVCHTRYVDTEAQTHKLVGIIKVILFMKQHESTFAKLFRHWLKAKPFPYSCTFELKDTRRKEYFPFSEFAEAQEMYADAITYGKGVLLRNQGGSGEPDYTYHYKEPAYIAIRYPEGFEVIKVENFVAEREKSKEKSLSYSKAREISTYSVRGADLKKIFK